MSTLGNFLEDLMLVGKSQLENPFPLMIIKYKRYQPWKLKRKEAAKQITCIIQCTIIWIGDEKRM